MQFVGHTIVITAHTNKIDVVLMNVDKNAMKKKNIQHICRDGKVETDDETCGTKCGFVILDTRSIISFTRSVISLPMSPTIFSNCS
jgi:hypothetical protein